MVIRITDNEIELTGHAGDKIRCGQASVLTSGVLDYAETVLRERPDYTLCHGHFRIDRRSLKSHDAGVVLDFYANALQRMAEQMPDHFTLV